MTSFVFMFILFRAYQFVVSFKIKAKVIVSVKRMFLDSSYAFIIAEALMKHSNEA